MNKNEAIRLAVKALESAEEWFRSGRSGSYGLGKVKEALESLRHLLDQTSAGVGDAVVGFDMGAPEGDLSCLMIGEKKPDGRLDIQHCVYGAEAEALYRALNTVPALRRALTQADQQASEKGYPYQDHMDAFEKRLVEPADKDDRREAWKALKSLVYGGGNIGADGKDDGGHRNLKGTILFDHWKTIERALSGSDGREFGNAHKLQLMNVALSEWIAARTGLPIDFQFQHRSDANAEFDGPRYCRGMMKRSEISKMEESE